MTEPLAPDVAFLRPYLIDDEPDANDEWSGHCPFHNDQNASASFNFEKGVWRCFAGCPDGSIGELIYRLEEMDGDPRDAEVVIEGEGGIKMTANVSSLDSARRRRRGAEPLPSGGTVAGWHTALMRNSEALETLMQRRGFTEATVERMKLGWDADEGAYTIPFVENGVLVNVKHYRLDPGPKQKKMWGYAGHNEARLYPSPPEDDTVLLCEGEMDAILANQHGFDAVTGSGGAKVWKSHWNEHFQDRVVYVCYDADKTGHEGRKVALRHLQAVASQVWFVDLPYEVEEKHGKDLTDLFHEVGADEFKVSLKELMADARHVHGSLADQSDDEDDWEPEAEPEEITLSVMDSMDIRRSDKPGKMRVQVSGRLNRAKHYPKTFTIRCTNDKPACSVCPIAQAGGSYEAKVDPDSQFILDYLEGGKNEKAAIVQEWGLACKEIWIEDEELDNVEELFVRRAIDELEKDDVDEDTVSNRKIYSVGRHSTQSNQTVEITGRVVPSKANRSNEFLAWDVRQTETGLDHFEMTDEMFNRLKVFQPSEGRTPLKQMGHIARDLAANVTNILGRRDMHIAMDLVWHSALNLRLNGKPLDRGWLELLVIGDTRTGKSAVGKALSLHYHAGRMFSCEAASFAGLVGGATKAGSSDDWIISWGALPMSDRRLIVLDEVSGMSKEDLSKMSGVRASGMAEVQKIEADRAYARTRLVWISNPRGGKAMDEFQNGVAAMDDLIDAQEDIARFDLAMAVTKQDVDTALINTMHHDPVPHVYTSDLCHDLVMWGWSRTSDQIRWGKGAEREVFSAVDDLSKIFTESPPLIQAANVREKIARIAAAMAIRTFSTKNGEHVIITKQHVRDTARFMTHLYSNPRFGYRDMSRRYRKEMEKAEGNRDVMMNELLGDPSLERFFGDMGSYFESQDLQSYLNLSREEARAKTTKFWEIGMITPARSGRGFKASPVLNEVLREMMREY